MVLRMVMLCRSRLTACLAYSWTLKVQTTHSREMTQDFYQTMWHFNLEEHLIVTAVRTSHITSNFYFWGYVKNYSCPKEVTIWMSVSVGSWECDFKNNRACQEWNYHLFFSKYSELSSKHCFLVDTRLTHTVCIFKWS
jgi:hypothetical protein